MRGKNIFLFGFLFLLSVSIVNFIGCDRDDPDDVDDRMDDADTLVVPDIDTAAVDTTEDQAAAADLKGTWSGTFDQRGTTLRITEQNGNEFKGVVSISYREPINQTVTGKYDPETNKMTMTDQVHSRYMGTYNGTVSENGSKYSGTFTMKNDGSKFNFALTKK